MRLTVFLSLLLSVCGCQPASTSTVLVLTGGTVINVLDGSQLSSAAVVVEGGRITAVTPSRDVIAPAHATRVDVTGKYVIPGLWDLHTHIQDHSSRHG